MTTQFLIQKFFILLQIKFRMFRCGPERAGIGFEGNRSIQFEAIIN